MRTLSRTPTRPTSAPGTTRRRFLGGACAAGAGTLLAPRLAFATPDQPALGDAVVTVFLRGGCDGLSLTPPYGYQSYRDLRPTIAIPPPGEVGGALPLTSASAPSAQFPTGLDGVIGLHPAMQQIYDAMWTTGRMAIVPAAGLPRSESRTRSHFEAERYWERGSAAPTVRSGWLNRMLAVQGGGGLVPGVNTSSQATDLMLGSAKTITVPRLDRFGISGFPSSSRAASALATLYPSGAGTRVGDTGSDVLSVVDVLGALEHTAPSYPSGGFGSDLRDIALMLRAGIGLRAASVDLGGWDHHGELGAPGDTDGRFWNRAQMLGDALRAFVDDLGPAIDEVTILVITEFGRTINENGSQGTDHGRGASIMAMGGGIQGGVFGYDYPDVIADDPDEGDLTILTDYRQMVAEVLTGRAGLTDLGAVFPTFTPGTPLGLAP
ncbi:MAG: DUF1501 domain-containing protein [Acidimicrobiales bacterium]